MKLVVVLSSRHLRGLLYGAVAGVNGAACMSVLRLAMRRAGIIEKMPPQVVEDWLARRIGLEPPGGSAGHHVADHVIHLGIGATAGAMYGALTATRRPTYTSGLLHGLTVWSVGFVAMIPNIGIARSAADADTGENVVNVAAHVVYGLVLALLVQAMRDQHRRPASAPERYATRVG